MEYARGRLRTPKTPRAGCTPAHDRELSPPELTSLVCAARAIANEVVQGTPSSLGLGAPLMHALIIDGRSIQEHMVIPVLSSSRAARLLNKDPRGFGAAVKQLYL